MIMRVDQYTINTMKKAIEDFLPHYLDVDYKMPTSYYIKSTNFE